MTISLGIHVGHDGGAALCRDGEIVVACHEERLTRNKYANGWRSSVWYCLEAEGISIDQCDIIVFSNAGTPLPENFTGGLETFCRKALRIQTTDHHLSHAIGGFCFSPYTDALVYVADAGGNNRMTESAYAMDVHRWEKIMNSPPARCMAGGLGSTYEAFTNFLGFSDQESGKTMALAAFGNADAIQLPELFSVNNKGEIASQLEAPHYWGVHQFSERNGNFLGQPFPSIHSSIAKDIAAYVQRSFTNAILKSTDAIVSEKQGTNLVLSGGVALNCIANQKLSDVYGSEYFYPFPVCSDLGLPIGNAFLGHWQLEGALPKPKDQSMRYGRSYSEAEILSALDRHPDTVPPGRLRHGDIEWHRATDPVKIAAEYLREGAIISWWQGKSETGPRALGGRSILASPTTLGIRDKLNERVKLREWFRPLAPSVHDSYLTDVVSDPGDYRYMNMAPQVTQEGLRQLPEAVHIDGTARIQGVGEHVAPELTELLLRLEKSNTFPALINTSFNIQEPIVESPGDAIATFLRSRMDVLILQDFVCTRKYPSNIN